MWPLFFTHLDTGASANEVYIPDDSNQSQYYTLHSLYSDYMVYNVHHSNQLDML